MMQHDEASNTTQGPARLRAAHQVLDHDPKIHVDPVVVGLTPESSADSIRADEASLRSRPLSLMRSAFVLRARHAEDCLAEAAVAGVSQYVVLGAGLDTFAYRQPHYATAMRIFEVDHRATQAWKRGCLARRGIVPPPNLTFVAMDFERDRLAERLRDKGFDVSRPAFLSWLGVVQYLSGPAIEAMLRFIARLARGSAVTLSFCLPDDLLAGDDLEVARRCANACATRGEPWLSRHRPEDLSAMAVGVGFSSTWHLTPETAAGRYFRDRSDGLRAPRYSQLLTATV